MLVSRKWPQGSAWSLAKTSFCRRLLPWLSLADVWGRHLTESTTMVHFAQKSLECSWSDWSVDWNKLIKQTRNLSTLTLILSLFFACFLERHTITSRFPRDQPSCSRRAIFLMRSRYPFFGVSRPTSWNAFVPDICRRSKSCFWKISILIYCCAITLSPRLSGFLTFSGGCRLLLAQSLWPEVRLDSDCECWSQEGWNCHFGPSIFDSSFINY